MSSGLEDKIIAYFDGELSDADSAELLHLTSVSPEIRGLFREHEMLRDLAQESTRSVMVSPEVESSLFSRIEALAENPVHEKAILVFSRRTALLAALSLILISGSLGYIIPKFFSDGSQLAVSSQGKGNIVQAALAPNSISSQQAENFGAKNISNSISALSSSKHIASLSEAPLNQIPLKKKNDEIALSNGTNKRDVLEHPVFETQISKANSEIKPIALRFAEINSEIGRERYSPFDRKDDLPGSRSFFEASLQTSSGFTYPADAAPIKPFAEQRLSIAYHITENNLIGFRLGSGLYQQLGNVTRTVDNGAELLSRNVETKRSFSEELYLSHLEPIFFAGNLLIEFSIGGGFIPNGYTISGEAGIRIPFSENFMFGASFALSRIHSNAISSSEILASENSNGKPVMLDAVDIHNTLNGRLHYGIIYRF